MPEFFVSWDFNIPGRRYSFELKFSEHSIDRYAYVWVKLEVEILGFDL
jgi:hypothetical protein